MDKYLLIESRSPFDSKEVENNYQLASDLANAGKETTLFLVENAVFAIRSTATTNLEQLANVTVLADEFSLKERGINESELCQGIKPANIGVIIDAMAQGQKTIWL